MSEPNLTQTNTPSPKTGEGSAARWPWRFRNVRRKPNHRNAVSDPWLRLRNAIVCQAVIDLVEPPFNPRPTRYDLYTARLLVQQCRPILREMDIPVRKIDYLLEWLNANDIAMEAGHVS